jgi:hypothetical protein
MPMAAKWPLAWRHDDVVMFMLLGHHQHTTRQKPMAIS